MSVWEPMGQVWVAELSGSMEENNSMIIGIFGSLDRAKLFVDEYIKADEEQNKIMGIQQSWVASNWTENRWDSNNGYGSVTTQRNNPKIVLTPI